MAIVTLKHTLGNPSSSSTASIFFVSGMPDLEDHPSGASNKLSLFKPKWSLLVLLILILIGIGFGVVCYLSSPTPPRVTIYSIEGEDFQASSGWSMGFSVRNSNKLVKFSYEQTKVIVYDVDMNVVLSSAEIPAFFLSSRSDVFVVSNSAGSMSNVNGSTQALGRSVPEYLNGVAVGMTVKVDSAIRISPVGFFFSRRRRFVAVCKEVLVTESGRAFLNGPKPCFSSISSKWKYI